MTTKEALADATAGVSGSLVAMLAFYPIDVIKTNLQAEKPCEKAITTEDEEGGVSGGINKSKKERTSTQRLISIIANIKRFSRGLHYKTAHTVTSSFVYFFLYSWIQSQHRLYHVRKSRGRNYLTEGKRQEGETLYRPSPSDRLILSAIAAMMNTILTLPLDVLAARSQTEVKDGVITEDSTLTNYEPSSPSNNVPTGKATKTMMDHVWDDVHNLGKVEDQYGNAEEEEECLVYSGADGNKSDIGNVGLDEKNGCHLSTTVCNDINQNEDNGVLLTSTPIFRIDSLSQLWKPSSLLPKLETNLSSNHDLAGLWRGLWPSLLLCSNPSIHFTVFDIAKESVIKYKLAQQRQNTTVINKGLSLSLGEAFIIGIIAKFAATILTYPLIRAKVMLMVTRKKTNTSLNGGNPSEDESDISMVTFLRDTFTSDGIVGLYKGCQLQLVHTLLKSALLMMVRERISVSSRRLIVGKQ